MAPPSSHDGDRLDIDGAPHRPADVYAPDCPSRSVLDHVTSRWGVLALVVLLERGTLRFSELRRAVAGVSDKMLAQTLRTLEADGLVVRQAYPEVPPRVEYQLSELGQGMAERLSELVTWIEANLEPILAARQQRRSTRT
jgi:DNA-binding HxlR family transcriptional regulator